MKQYNISVISGRLEKSPGLSTTPVTQVSFRAEDWRKRGGEIIIQISPSSDCLRKFLPSEPEKNTYEPAYLKEKDGTQVVRIPKVGRYKNSEFQAALAKTLGYISCCWNCSIADLKLDPLSQLQFVSVDGKDMPYEEYVERQMKATVLEEDLRPWIMACAQAAQRLEYLDKVEHLYLTRTPVEISGGGFHYLVDPTDKPIYFLVRSLITKVDPIPKDDREAFRSSVLGKMGEKYLGTTHYTLSQFVDEWERGSFTLYNAKQTAHFLHMTIDWICRKYGLDEWKYFHAKYDYLHKAKVCLVGEEPNTYVVDFS